MSQDQDIGLLTSGRARQFIQDHLQEDPAGLALRYHGEAAVSAFLRQLDARQRAAAKLPDWSSNYELVFPPLVSVEQASSQDTAIFKSTLAEACKHLVDLTGGFGVDAYYFSKKCDHVTVVEENAWLCEIMRHNFIQLGAKNISVINARAENFSLPEDADFLYADPSRRAKGGRRVFSFSDYQPDPLQVAANAVESGCRYMIKSGPMTDIQAGMNSLQDCQGVYVVSRERQVRELLFVNFAERPGVISVAALSSDFFFSFTAGDEKRAEVKCVLPEPGGFLYDPDPAITKAGCFKLIAQATGTQPLHLNTHLYYSASRQNFPGRTFQIIEVYPAEIKKKWPAEFRVTVATKNFPGKASDIQQKIKCKPDDSGYLWFVTLADNSRAMILCRKVHEHAS